MNDPTMTAVVVNDDPTQLGILCELVAKAGLKPLPFTGAEVALRAMNPEARPGLIVTDLYMPGIDGWRFCRLLRSAEYAAFNEVPILVVSATFAGDHPARLADDIGADAFLPSPVDGMQFVAQVRALLRGEAARRLPRVLIVEDSKTLSGLLKKAFAAHGYQAEVAGSIREAEEAVGQTAYDVAVLDYHLPDGTGDVLLDAIQAGRPECVCLMMTTDPTPELALSWMKRGAAAYLRKPFEPDYLIELCARARRERALTRVEDLLDARTRELRDERRRLEAILEGTRAGTWEWNVQTGETVFNERWAEIAGYTLAELAPVSIRTWETLAHPDDLPGSGELLARHFAGDLPYYHCDCRIRHKDGRWIWVHDHGTVTSWTPDGKPLWMSGAHIDITERKRVEQALRESEERFRAANDASLDALLLLRSDRDEDAEVRDFVFLDVNRRTEEMLRMSRDQLLGKRLCEVLPINRESTFFEKYKRVADTGVPLEEEFFLPETHVPAAWHYPQYKRDL